jgi:hypothetical protein
MQELFFYNKESRVCSAFLLMWSLFGVGVGSIGYHGRYMLSFFRIKMSPDCVGFMERRK